MNLVEKVLNFCIPISCAICGERDWVSSKLGVCKSCAFPINKANFDERNCAVCKSPLILEQCEYCESRNVFFTEFFYLRMREKREKELLQALKFQEAKRVSNYFRLGVGKFIPIWKELKFTAIVPIPSNRKTVRDRPYHVCHSLFPYLERKLNVPIIKMLIKKSKELQSGKTYRNRFFHARFAFEMDKRFAQSLKGNYLILDDLFTTGASLNEGARILLENGAENVYGFSFLRGK